MEYFSKLSSFLSGDFVFLTVLFLAIFGYTMYFGRGKIVAFILSFYPATILYNNLPFLDSLIVLKGDVLITLNKIVLFAILFILLNIITNRYIVSISNYGKQPSILSNLVLSIGGVVLVVLFSYTTVNLDVIYDPSTTIDALFSRDISVFVWSLVPLALLAMF